MTGSNKIQRRPFVASLLGNRDGALIIPGLGSPTWDCFSAGDSPEYLYSWGGMGLAVPTALGLALAQPDKRVLALTGDGEMMMGIGSLGVVADQAPSNLGILVLDNEHFGETGRQTGLSANQADLCKIAEGFGIKHTRAVTEQGAVDELAEFLFKTPGPVFATAKIALSDDPWMLPVKDGVAIARRFRVALGVEAN
jgi:thiamine pyrophosphate-dependent acetolactate synthase large subunit-like protein